MLALTDQGASPRCPGSFNLAAHVLAPAARLPDKVALAIVRPDGAERWRFARLEAAVRGTATGLLALGLVPGDRVLMRLGNTVEFPLAYLGAIAAGLVPIPTSPQLTAREVADVLATADPRLILRGDGIACPETDLPVLDEAALDAMRDLPPAEWHMGDPHRPGYIVYTSGTSGSPRAVMHAHRAILAREMMDAGWYGLTEADRLCHAGAFNWTFTLGTGLLDPWRTGATALIPAPGVAPAQLPLLLKRFDATIFAAAPGVYRKMLARDMPPLPRLRHGLAAGEKLSETIRDRWHAATGTAIHEAYGLSECSTFISASPESPAPPGTLGRAQQGRRVAIIGDAGAPVACGADGTIAVHKGDPGLMLGYIGAPGATAAKFSGEWFLTGDRGAMDETGAITYLGRADDMMNAGGFRVSPIEVEAALSLHPGIREVAVTDIDVKEDARLIMAFYTGPETIDPASLDAHCRDRLAAYKCPRGFFHLESLPTGPNGKLLRRALRPRYKALNGPA